MQRELRPLGSQREQFVESGNGDDGYAEFRRDLLRRGMDALPALLAVECYQYAGGRRAVGTDQRQRLARRRTGTDHIIDDQYATLQWCPDQHAAFTMVLGFLAIERHWQVTPVCKRKSDGCRGGEYDAFVGGTE